MTGKTIIFLDIDGVLQPHHQQDRFNHDMEKLREALAERFDNPDYLEMDRYDLAAVYYDWHKDAVERLRSLCVDFDAEIVISSAWRRSSPLYTLQCFFRIHDLHDYIVDVTVQDSQEPLYRAGEVKQYVDTHPEIERFVIFDDQESRQFKMVYPHNFVHTRSWIEEKHYQRARQILDGTVPHYEAKQAMEEPHFGYFVSEIDTGRLLASVGHTAHRAYVFPLNTPRGLGVLQEHPFDHPFHNGVFVGQNEVICGDRRANFWSHHGDWRQPDNPTFEERGIIRYNEAPRMESLPFVDQTESLRKPTQEEIDRARMFGDRLEPPTLKGQYGIRFIYESTWHDANDQPMLDEVRTIDIYEGEDGVFCDLISQKIATYGPLEFQQSRHGSIGIRVQPQLLPALGGAVVSDPDSYSHGLARGLADRVANGRHRDFAAFEANLRPLGVFGVCLLVIKNEVSRKDRSGDQTTGNQTRSRTHQSGWGANRLPDHLRGPWFIRDYGMAMFNATQQMAINVEEGESWTAGLRVVAYDEKLTSERVSKFREIEANPSREKI